ncbi:MAG: hypothetical protein Q9227_001805 [Pyrenula ochraceoflavens]
MYPSGLARLASSRTTLFTTSSRRPLPRQSLNNKPRKRYQSAQSPAAEQQQAASKTPSSSSSPSTPPSSQNAISWYHRLHNQTLSPFLTWFSHHSTHSPYRTQLATSLLTYLTGDLIAQNLDPSTDYDPLRTLRHLTIGALAAIPGYHWFLYLGRHFNYASKLLSISTKVVVQQVVFAPIFNTYFFGMQSLLSGGGISGAVERIRKTVPESVVNACKVWPAVTAVNFTVVPVQYRFMCAGAVACLWQSYLSWLNQRAARGRRREMEIGGSGEEGEKGGDVKSVRENKKEKEVLGSLVKEES